MPPRSATCPRAATRPTTGRQARPSAQRDQGRRSRHRQGDGCGRQGDGRDVPVRRRQVPAFTHSGGAGETGLARMTELHASHTAGDAAMMLALAGNIFFNPQTAEARSQVAGFLLLTMIPFTLIAPFVGPLLDRFSQGGAGRSGRRWRPGRSSAGSSPRRSTTRATGSSPPRSACSSPPRPTTSPALPPSRDCSQRARVWSGPTRGSRSPGSSAPSSAGGSRGGPEGRRAVGTAGRLRTLRHRHGPGDPAPA